MVFLTEQELNYVYQENLKYLLSCIHAFYFYPNVNRNKAKAETFKALSRVNKNRQALFLKPLTFNDIKVYKTSAFIKF